MAMRRDNRNFDKSGEGNIRLQRKKKPCSFCINNVNELDYKEVDKIRKYISDRGKILPRRVTGNCAKHQRMVTESVKRARVIALVPYVAE